MRVLIIDNFDSFTFNLYQCVGEILLKNSDSEFSSPQLKVVRNNGATLTDIKKYSPSHIVLSPGPGSPEESRYFGVCKDVIHTLGTYVPLLGVCLGMQGIAHCFGASVVRAPVPMHGKISHIEHANVGVFQGLPQNLEVMRYHSLMVDQRTLPECLEVTAVVSGTQDVGTEDDRVIMGVRHTDYPIEGVQFHPESFATEGARDILKNFLYQALQDDFGHSALEAGSEMVG